MQELLEFIQPYIDGICTVSMVLLFLVNAFLGRRTNNKILEVLMKFRTADYRQNMSDNDKLADGQIFDPLVPQYKLNKHTDELEEQPDKLDVQKLINSNKECALDKMLDKLMPYDETGADNLQGRIDDTYDDLDVLSEAMDTAEDYRDKLGLTPETSLMDVYRAVDKYRLELREELNKLSQQQQQPQSEVKKDVEAHAQETDPSRQS